jgi:hypothetical protein
MTSAYSPRYAIVSVAAGSTRCCAWSSTFASPSSVPGSWSPPTGNQPSDTAKTESRSIPSQKSGIEYVAIVNVVDA